MLNSPDLSAGPSFESLSSFNHGSSYSCHCTKQPTAFRNVTVYSKASYMGSLADQSNRFGAEEPLVDTVQNLSPEFFQNISAGIREPTPVVEFRHCPGDGLQSGGPDYKASPRRMSQEAILQIRPCTTGFFVPVSLLVPTTIETSSRARSVG